MKESMRNFETPKLATIIYAINCLVHVQGMVQFHHASCIVSLITIVGGVLYLVIIIEQDA